LDKIYPDNNKAGQRMIVGIMRKKIPRFIICVQGSYLANAAGIC
jgi:hypothetical protein